MKVQSQIALFKPEQMPNSGLKPIVTTSNQTIAKPIVSRSADDKGELNGKCNITSCQKPNSATWYNHSTRKYYCLSCARRLNTDEFNKRDAMRMFGHDLCTEAV